MEVDSILSTLRAEGNLRIIPADTTADCVVDLSQNDYLGLASDKALREEFFGLYDPSELPMTSSASRLLASAQRPYADTERLLADLYGSDALLFNSGWHANTGLVSALVSRDTLILADRLVHASIIDGIRLSGARFERFRHNDYDHLVRLLEANRSAYADVLIIAESVYSMDGDKADIQRLVDIKRHFGAMLYVDEAHAVGVLGLGGLGLCAPYVADVDVIVGTFGKALASVGAYAIMRPELKQLMVNRARSFIFSTALPPINILWSKFVLERLAAMDDRRNRLMQLCGLLSDALGTPDRDRYIAPYIVGNPAGAVRLSESLLRNGFKVLPIRRPTVPPGTDRLRFSLSADLDPADLVRLKAVFQSLIDTQCSSD